VNTPELLKLEDAAAALGVSVRTLRRRIAGGALPVFRDRAVVRIRDVDLRRYVAERVAIRDAVSPASASPGRTVAPGARLWD
jgi:excisionase family DNA binding protein